MLGLVAGGDLFQFDLRLLPAITYQLTAASFLKNDSLLARHMSLHHGLISVITDLRNNHLTCFTDMLYSSMFPGNLPSQLEIFYTGQNYYETRL